MYQRFSVITVQLPLVTSNHTDIAFQAIDKNRVFYKIESIDSCQHSFFSNYAATVFASVMPLDNFTNKITWTAYDNLLGRVQYYDVFKKTANGAVKIATATANSLQTEEKLNPSVEENQDACYYVVAYANVRLPPNNTPFNVTSRSNTVCAHQTISLAMPNAFAPEGTNSVFKPAAVFTKTTNYSMQIYDRWGGIVFQSNDIDTGWDGSINGKPCPQGVYVYVIKAQETNKKNIEKRGSVMLLR
jgi:gliding motility-associated-like protein